MNERFEPKYPRSISGKSYRVPLDHRDTEQLAAEMDKLYRIAALTETERGQLLKTYRRLRSIDRSFLQSFSEMELPTSELRAKRPDQWFLDHRGHEVQLAFYWLLRDHVNRLNAKYFGFARPSDDI